jgi:hypothetical protein
MDLCGEWGIILKYILRKQGMRIWTEFMWLGGKSKAGFCEHGNEKYGSIKRGEFLNKLRDYHLLCCRVLVEALPLSSPPPLRVARVELCTAK